MAPLSIKKADGDFLGVALRCGVSGWRLELTPMVIKNEEQMPRAHIPRYGEVGEEKVRVMGKGSVC